MNERKLKQLNIVVLIAVITGIACIVIFAAFFAPKEQNKIRGGRMEKFNESWMKRSYGEDGNEISLLRGRTLIVLMDYNQKGRSVKYE